MWLWLWLWSIIPASVIIFIKMSVGAVIFRSAFCSSVLIADVSPNLDGLRQSCKSFKVHVMRPFACKLTEFIESRLTTLRKPVKCNTIGAHSCLKRTEPSLSPVNDTLQSTVILIFKMQERGEREEREERESCPKPVIYYDAI
jgi:hypothetical protein